MESSDFVPDHADEQRDAEYELDRWKERARVTADAMAEAREETERLLAERADAGGEEEAEEAEEEGDYVPLIRRRSKRDVPEKDGGDEQSKRPRESKSEQDDSKPAGPMTPEQRRQYLFEVRMKMNEARKLNRQEVYEEDKRAHMPRISPQQQERLAWKEAKEKIKEERVKRGEIEEDEDEKDYLHDTVLKAEYLHKKKEKKEKNQKMDYHSSLWINEAASVRAYKKRCKDIPITPEMYEELKKTLPPSELYREADSLSTGRVHVAPPAAFVDKMVERLKKDEEGRENFHRRRPVLEDETVDYIHGGNKKFNKKLAKAFDRYTTDIRENLERGTAL